MTEKGTAQWTLRKTPERQELMRELRELLEETRPGTGERIHGALTDAQIFVWGLLELHASLNRMKQDEPPVMFQAEHRPK